jgi:hypothetical protein
LKATRFDTVTKLFANRRSSRRQALAHGGAGLAAPALAVGQNRTSQAQEASPVPATDDTQGPETLFLQTFQAGSITPNENADGTFTLTLEGGVGQTIYFSNRPGRDVGVTPTPAFLAALGFPDDNPPNAALVIGTEDDTDIAVIELFNPQYDEATQTATYDVTILKEWESTLDLGFTEAPTDLAQFHPTFGAAHLFIDDCPNYFLTCVNPATGWGGSFDHTLTNGFCYSWAEAQCLPCKPWLNHNADVLAHWSKYCNDFYPDYCQNTCYADWTYPYAAG